MRRNFQYDVEGLMAKDKAHAMHPWHEFGRAEHTLLADSEGIYVYDGAGNRYIDGIAGMWAVQLGYGNEEMAQAISDQVRRMVYYSPWSMATPPHAEVSAKLATLTPGDLNRFFYSTGGSTANDAAIPFRSLLLERDGAPVEEARPHPRRRLSRQHLPRGFAVRQAGQRHAHGARDRVDFTPLVAQSVSQARWCDRRAVPRQA